MVAARDPATLASPLVAEAPATAPAAVAAEEAAPRSRTPRNPFQDPETRVAIQQLQARDREVRSHEQAHLAAAGPLVKAGPFYSYIIGPDGKRYAVGGSVEIDTREVPDNPEATIEKAQRVRAAALAPAQPSGADLAVAATASRMESRAQMELARREAAEAYSRSPTGSGPGQVVAVAA
jgi:hypothetical protein